MMVGSLPTETFSFISKNKVKKTKLISVGL